MPSPWKERNHRGKIQESYVWILFFSYISALVFFIPLPKADVHSEKSRGQDKIVCP